jgi:hypothetical protein
VTASGVDENMKTTKMTAHIDSDVPCSETSVTLYGVETSRRPSPTR